MSLEQLTTPGQLQLSYDGSEHYYLAPNNGNFYPLCIEDEDSVDQVWEPSLTTFETPVADPPHFNPLSMGVEEVENNNNLLSCDQQLADLAPDFNDEWMELSDDSTTANDTEISSSHVNSPRFDDSEDFVQIQVDNEISFEEAKESQSTNLHEELCTESISSVESEHIPPICAVVFLAPSDAVTDHSTKPAVNTTLENQPSHSNNIVSKRKKTHFYFTSHKKRKLFHQTWTRVLWTVGEMQVLLNMTIERQLVDTLPHAGEIKLELLRHDPASSKTLVQINNKRHAIFYRYRRGTLTIQDQLKTMITELELMSQHNPSRLCGTSHRTKTRQSHDDIEQDTQEIVFIDATPKNHDMSTIKQFPMCRTQEEVPLKAKTRGRSKSNQRNLLLSATFLENTNTHPQQNQSEPSSVTSSCDTIPNSLPSSPFLDFVLPVESSSPTVNAKNTTSRYPIVIHLPLQKPWAFHCFNAK